MFLSWHIWISEWIHTLYLPECQENPCSMQVQNLKFKWLQLDSNPMDLLIFLQKKICNWLGWEENLWRMFTMMPKNMAAWHLNYFQIKTSDMANSFSPWRLHDSIELVLAENIYLLKILIHGRDLPQIVKIFMIIIEECLKVQNLLVWFLVMQAN